MKKNKTIICLILSLFSVFITSPILVETVRADTNASPYPPSDFVAETHNTTQINLSWTKSDTADYTYIERNTVVSWNRGEGTQIYNNTGTSYSDTGLNDNTRYYYQAWSYNATNNTFSSVDWTGLDFDGANDDVRIPDDNSLDFTSSFSVDIALLVEDTPADSKFDAIISKMTDSTTGWGIALYSDDGVVWELHICVDGHNQSVGTASIPVNKWIYPTVVFNDTSDTMHVYINGNEVYSYSEPNTPSANTADVVIGECSYVGNDKTFDGKIDYIRLYNTALSEQDVKYNFYWKDSDCVSDGLVSWWRFNENTGTTVYDSHGSNDGTLEDGTTWVNGTKEVFNSAYNTTNSNPYVSISNIYPENRSGIYKPQPTVFFTLTKHTNHIVNFTVYAGNSSANTTLLIGSQNNATNGTYHYPYYTATSYSERYYWRIHIDVNNTETNETYNFRIWHEPVFPLTNSYMLGIIGLFGIIGLLGFISIRRK